MDVICTHCAGLDVHKTRVTACRITPEATGQQVEGLMERKECGPMTGDLWALSAWRTEVGLTQMAMERPGEYWKPVILRGRRRVFSTVDLATPMPGLRSSPTIQGTPHVGLARKSALGNASSAHATGGIAADLIEHD